MEVGVEMEKLRKACVIDLKCNKKVMFSQKFQLYSALNQNLFSKLKNLGYLKLFTAEPK